MSQAMSQATRDEIAMQQDVAREMRELANATDDAYLRDALMVRADALDLAAMTILGLMK